jgi:hypothetical protein
VFYEYLDEPEPAVAAVNGSSRQLTLPVLN